MELTPEHAQRLDSLLAQARMGVVDRNLAASVLSVFSDSDALVIGQLLKLLQGSRDGHPEQVLSSAPEAIRLLRRMGPESAFALWATFNALGIAHFRLHQYLTAHHWYEQSLVIAVDCQLRGEAQTSRINSGLAFRGLGDAERAVAELYRVAIDEQSLLGNRGASNLFLAHVYADQGDRDTELVHLRLSIESDSSTDILEARSMLARALARRGLIVEARQVLDDTSLEKLCDDMAFHWACYLSAHGETLAAEGRVGESLLCFEAASSKLDGSVSDIPVVMVGLGKARAHLLTNQNSLALQDLKSLDPEMMCIADAREYASMRIVACTRLDRIGDVLRAAADKVRLVDNRLAPSGALEAVRRRVELEVGPCPVPESVVLATPTAAPAPGSLAQPTLASIVHDPIENIRCAAAQRGVGVRVIDRASDVLLDIESKALDGPLGALLFNAVRFNRRAGFIEIQLLHFGDTAHVRILSTGVGWPPNTVPEALELGWYGNLIDEPSPIHERRAGPADQQSTIEYPCPDDGSMVESGLRRSIVDAQSVGCNIRGSSPGTGSGAVFTLEIPVAAPSDQLDLRAS